jgi:hypothetical protein
VVVVALLEGRCRQAEALDELRQLSRELVTSPAVEVNAVVAALELGGVLLELLR